MNYLLLQLFARPDNRPIYGCNSEKPLSSHRKAQNLTEPIKTVEAVQIV